MHDGCNHDGFVIVKEVLRIALSDLLKSVRCCRLNPIELGSDFQGVP